MVVRKQSLVKVYTTRYFAFQCCRTARYKSRDRQTHLWGCGAGKITHLRIIRDSCSHIIYHIGPPLCMWTFPRHSCAGSCRKQSWWEILSIYCCVWYIWSYRCSWTRCFCARFLMLNIVDRIASRMRWQFFGTILAQEAAFFDTTKSGLDFKIIKFKWCRV